MKKTKLINLTIIGTLFFTACSNKEPKIKDTSIDSKTIYNIIGINNSKEENLNIVNNYKEENFNIIEEETSSPIEVISYVSKPTVEPLENIEYISYKKNFFNRDKVVNNLEWNAKRFLGVPYVWGATGPDKFDCSGFTQWVYRDVGINIPRVSRDQARVGEYVNYDNLKRGDMVFFSTDKKRVGVVTHVGIYLGNGDFIHASSTGKKVVIYNFDKKEYYKKHFLWARRLIKTSSMYASN